MEWLLNGEGYFGQRSAVRIEGDKDSNLVAKCIYATHRLFAQSFEYRKVPKVPTQTQVSYRVAGQRRGILKLD